MPSAARPGSTFRVSDYNFTFENRSSESDTPPLPLCDAYALEADGMFELVRPPCKGDAGCILGLHIVPTLCREVIKLVSLREEMGDRIFRVNWSYSVLRTRQLVMHPM